MGKFAISCLALSALTTQVSSFSSPSTAIGLGVGTRSGQGVPLFLSSDNDQEHHYAPSRANFLNTSLSLIATTATLSLIPVDPAFARGRATLEQAYDRYSGRIIGGGNFYKNEMKTMIAKDDWAGIRAALQEPPKKNQSGQCQDRWWNPRTCSAGGTIFRCSCSRRPGLTCRSILRQ
mmetsp:Transcript_22213/g.46690  ORF Transcript_22213/g.46690 Transcript_22213/m.46690 type:complete len:177 (-) Transcript_22213:368-898(-)